MKGNGNIVFSVQWYRARLICQGVYDGASKQYTAIPIMSIPDIASETIHVLHRTGYMFPDIAGSIYIHIYYYFG